MRRTPVPVAEILPGAYLVRAFMITLNAILGVMASELQILDR